MFQDKLF